MKAKKIIAALAAAGALVLSSAAPAHAGKPVKVAKIASVHVGH